MICNSFKQRYIEQFSLEYFKREFVNSVCEFFFPMYNFVEFKNNCEKRLQLIYVFEVEPNSFPFIPGIKIENKNFKLEFLFFFNQSLKQLITYI